MDAVKLSKELGESVYDAIKDLDKNLLTENIFWIEEFSGTNYRITVAREDDCD